MQTVPGPSELSEVTKTPTDSAIAAPPHGINVVSKHPLLSNTGEKKEFLVSNGISSEKSLSILKPHIDRLSSYNKKLQEVTPMKGLPIVVSVSDSLVSVDTVGDMQRV